jgi:hypothetical protein
MAHRAHDSLWRLSYSCLRDVHSPEAPRRRLFFLPADAGAWLWWRENSTFWWKTGAVLRTYV